MTAEIENYLNEQDLSVGLYSLSNFDQESVEDFKQAFEGLEVIKWNKECLYFSLNKPFKHQDLYKVSFVEKYNNSGIGGGWKVSVIIQ